MTTIEEKDELDDAQHIDHAARPIVAPFDYDLEELPPGYFKDPYFLGSYFACGMNLMSSTGGFALIAPVITQINEALGPDPAIIWLSLVYTLGLALGLTLVGRVSDIFGRRWFLIGGVSLGLIGSIVCATAKNVPVLIGGQTLIGIAASTGYSYAFTMGELVPMKYRFFINASLFIFSYPTAGFGAAVSTAFILYTGPGFRWCYYLLIILNAITLLLYIIFYFPPNFHMLHGRESKLQWIKNFDYVGTLLYMAGLTLFILGLSWGGSAYEWKDSHVIATIVVGTLCLIGLFAYESLMSLKEPLIPMYLFKDFGWVASALILSIGAVVYYGFAIVWPQMASTVYWGGDPMTAGWAATLIGNGITTGELVGGIFAKKIGKTKFQCMTAITLGSLLLGLTAVATPDTPKTAMALVFLATFAIGYNEMLALTICTICIKDQKDIGVAAGTAGSIRSAIGTVGSTIYVITLTSRLKDTIPARVPPAVIAAGLPTSSVPDYFTAFTNGTAAALEGVRGITPDILAAGSRAFQFAYADAYRTVFFSTIAFGVVAIGLTFFVPNVDHLLTNSVAATLHSRGNENVLRAVEGKTVEAEV